MSLYNILVDISANTAAFESGMKRATDTLESFGKIAKAGLELTGVSLGLTKLTESVVALGDQGEQLVQLATRMGTTTRSLSQLQYAAQATQVPFVALTGAMDTLQRNLVQASEGSGKAKHALEDLGIDAAKLAALPLDAQLGIIADKIKSLPSPTQQTAAAMRIFGDAGATLLPILRQGHDGIDAFRAKSDALGATINDSTAIALANMKQSMEDLHTASQSLWIELVGDSAPAITRLENQILEFIDKTHNFLNFGTTNISQQDQLLKLTQQAVNMSKALDSAQAGSHSLMSRIGAFVGNKPDFSSFTDGLQKITGEIADLEQRMGNSFKPEGPAPNANAGEDLLPVQVTALKTLTNYMQQYYDSINTMSQTDVERTADSWQQKEFAARQTYAEGIIDFTEYQNRIAALNDQFLQPVAVTAKYIANTGKTVYDEMQRYAMSAAQSIQSDFATFLEDPSVSSFKRMAVAWVQTLAKMEADAAASQIFKMLFKGDNTQTTGLSGILGSALGALFSGGGGAMSVGASAALGASASSGSIAALDDAIGVIAPLMHFANGGSFNVGGSGGTDSQLVAFKATPGEHVQVGGAGDGPITIHNYVTVTSPQVTKGDVLAAMQQTQNSTVAKLQDMKRRRKF